MQAGYNALTEDIMDFGVEWRGAAFDIGADDELSFRATLPSERSIVCRETEK